VRVQDSARVREQNPKRLVQSNANDEVRNALPRIARGLALDLP
jgi:hypothetical protein